MNLPLGCSKRKYRSSSGFTIVELIVVIVIIGVLATILIYAYTGFTQKAKSASLQSDLADASTALKVFYAHNDSYPTTISTDCSASPDTTTNKCIKLTNGNAVVGYSANNQSSSQTFLLVVNNGSTAYKITENSKPTLLASTQPGVTPGAIVELHAAKAKNGTSPGINSPSTTTWTDTSGNGNNGTLTNMAGTTASGWTGSGTTGDPYRAVFDGVDDYVSTAYAPGLGDFTVEVWAAFGSTSGMNGLLYGYAFNGPSGWGLYCGDSSVSGFLTTASWVDRIHFNKTHSNDDVMHQFVAVFARSGLMSIYLDAGTPGTADISSKSALNLSTAGKLGVYNGWFAKESTAIARIYPFALSAAQVTTNYSRGPSW